MSSFLNRTTMLGAIAAALLAVVAVSSAAADGSGVSKHELHHLKAKGKTLTVAEVRKIAKQEAQKYANSNPGPQGVQGPPGGPGPQGPPGADVSGGTVKSVGSGSGLTGGPITLEGVLEVNFSETQKRVTGTCPSGQAIRTIAEAGTVTCQTAGSAGVTEVKSGAGLEGGPITTTGELKVKFSETQKRVTGTCPSGEAVVKVEEAGTVDCEKSGLPETLRPGATEMGVIVARGSAAGTNASQISFPIPTPTAPEPILVKSGEDKSAEGCPKQENWKTPSVPEADEGKLCVYLKALATAIVSPFEDPTPGSTTTKSAPTGTVLPVTCLGSGCNVTGVWAVTAKAAP